MKLLVVSKFYPPVLGGVEVTVKELCQEFVRQGNQVTVLVMTKGARIEECVEGVRVARVPLDRLFLGGFNRAAFRLLDKELRSGGYDLVHLHNFHILLSFQSAILCTLHSMPYVFSPHYHGKGHTPLRDFLFRIYKKIGYLGLKKASLITCASYYERSMLLHDFPSLEEKTEVISPGIKARTHPRIPREKDVLLYVGRLMRYKGLDNVMAAMSVLRMRGRRIRLRIIGTGPDEERLRMLARDLQLEDSVEWLGEVDEEALNWEYAKASCLVLLSSAEAYGLVVAEALSSGLPCIVAESAALREFTSEPGCFGVRDPKDANLVADVIAKVLDQDIYINLDSFSPKISYWPEVAKRYLDRYSIVLRKGSAEFPTQAK
ncbi:MAG: glycosyltransferase family 4 protein [Methanomassiliicoccales archaeon]